MATLLGADGSSFADDVATSTNTVRMDASVDFISLAPFWHSIEGNSSVVHDGLKIADVV